MLTAKIVFVNRKTRKLQEKHSLLPHFIAKQTKRTGKHLLKIDYQFI